MKTGDKVIWGGAEFSVLVELDDNYVYLVTSPDGAQLVHVSGLTPA